MATLENGQNILIIDDDTRLSGIIGEVLKFRDHQVQYASTVKDGLEMAEHAQPPFDGFICDGCIDEEGDISGEYQAAIRFAVGLREQRIGGWLILHSGSGDAPEDKIMPPRTDDTQSYNPYVSLRKGTNPEVLLNTIDSLHP
jgi:hypothetical protein